MTRPRTTDLALLLGAFLVLALAAAPARGGVELACTTCLAGEESPQAALDGLLHQVALGDQCVRVAKVSGRDTLINRCRICRFVKINRRRGGGAKAVDRSYTMPAKSSQTLSFRGPGQSRITSDIPCDKSVELENDRNRRAQDKRCADLRDVRGRGPTLLNMCRACRIVIVERDHLGTGKTAQTYTIGSRAYIPVATHGARSARIKSDKPCR